MRDENHRSKSRTTRSHRSYRPKAVRLQVERLECRRLLAGLNVAIYVDQNASGNYDSAFDQPAPNRIVYIDLDRSGAFEDGEPMAITDDQGIAHFRGLEPGNYSVGVLTNEQFQKVVDPIDLAHPITEAVSADLRTLSNTIPTAESPESLVIKSSRQLDILVRLGQGNGFVGAKRVGEKSELEVLSPSGTLLDSIVVDGMPESLVVDSASGHVALATDQATRVFQHSSGTLEPIAVLEDAAAPLALKQNQLASADRSDRGSWIVWNTATWLPIRRDQLANSPLLDVAIADDASHVTALTEGFLHRASFRSGNGVVNVGAADEIASLRMGVQVSPSAPSISIEPLEIRRVAEGADDSFDLRQWIGSTGELDYWFTLEDSAENGQLSVLPSGSVAYAPHSGFWGREQVVLRVFDGISSFRLPLIWQIEESNHPPTDMIIEVPAFAENVPVGSELGFVTIIDPNAGASYRVTTSDPRFRVEHGRLFLDGEVDFEREPQITLEFLAVDEQEQFSITTTATLTLVNVLEPPKAMLLSDSFVNEKTSNVVIGQITLLEPDSDGDYVLSVSDPRFSIEGNHLVLREPLLHSEASELTVTLTAIDRNSPEVQSSQSFTIRVNPVLNAPRDILISGTRVPEGTPGGIVGKLSTLGLSDGEVARYEVSDERFEVVDGILKLRQDVVLERADESMVTLAVTAIGMNGASMTVLFPLIVTPPISPWQNPFLPPDVNGDGRVTALDALLVINYLNKYGLGVVPQPPTDPGGGTGEPPNFHPDVNGDGRITALDVLLIINMLNSRSGGNSQTGNGEGDSGLSPEGEDHQSASRFGASVSGPQSDASMSMVAINPMEEAETRRKINSKIDTELEFLLDQLASDDQRCR